mgnify:CR=1 FL=1
MSVEIGPGWYVMATDGDVGSIWRPVEAKRDHDPADLTWPDDYEKVGSVPVSGTIAPQPFFATKPYKITGAGR